MEPGIVVHGVNVDFTLEESERLYTYLQGELGTDRVNLNDMADCLNTPILNESDSVILPTVVGSPHLSEPHPQWIENALPITGNLLMYYCNSVMWVYAEDCPDGEESRPISSYPAWVQMAYEQGQNLVI